ncbi:hypothetical protein KKJ05_08215 [Xenorhabdus bovienii]|nr:hypothetical protein [Xenorhabdus bovienii]
MPWIKHRVVIHVREQNITAKRKIEIKKAIIKKSDGTLMSSSIKFKTK